MARRGENIYKRKDGRWEGRFKTGIKTDGKPKYHSVYGKSYRAVKDRMIGLKSQNKTEPVAPGSVTVGKLLDEWMEAVRNRVKPSSFSNYQLKLEKHLIPAFGAIRYEMLTPDLVQQFIRNKLQDGLSAKYVSDIIVMFKGAIKYVSTVHGYKNAIECVSLPKAEKTEVALLDLHQQKRLCKYLTTHMDLTSLCVLISLYTGLRIGEVCGLMWGDIDFSKHLLTVSRTVQRIHTTHGTVLHIGSPKSKTSRRTIPVPAFLMTLLKRFQAQGNVYVLSGTTHATEPRTLQRRFQAILKKAALPSQRYHSLRHLFATNALRLGFDIKTLSELLGHSTPQTTLNRYLHSSLEQKIACMKMLDHVA